MLRGIVSYSVKHAGVIIGFAIALFAFGIFSLSKAQYDVFPEFAPPQVTIQTESRGLSPEQVELLVTQPLENAIAGVSGIESIRSSSIQGLSLIKINFNPRSDIYLNRQVVSERLSTVSGELPKGVKPPVLTPLTSSTNIVMIIGLGSESKSLQDIRTLADWVVKPRLLAVPGVAKVVIFGGYVKQYQIQLKPEKLFRYSLSMNEVIDAAQKVTGIRGAGFIDTPNQHIVFQSNGNYSGSNELSKAMLVRGNNENVDLNISLDEVANVVEGFEPRVGAASISGKEAVELLISSQYGSNTRVVTEQLEKAMNELNPLLQSENVILYPNLFRPANFIETAIGNIKSDLIWGAILVIIVLFVFLNHVKTAFISAITIPLSLISAIVVLNYFGFTLNTMTLGGLAIAIGAVVDDAVIDVENILRRLRGNLNLEPPKPKIGTIIDASMEVRSAVVLATLAISLVFVPILTLTGVAGRLFSSLAIAYIAAILASLVVALTVTPALCFLLIKKRDSTTNVSPMVNSLKTQYHKILLKIAESPKAIYLIVILLILLCILLIPVFKIKFIPELKEGQFIVHMSAIPGTSIEESLRIGNRVSEALLKLPFVRSVVQQIGRAEEADDVYGTHYSEINVDLKSVQGKEAATAYSKVREVLKDFPGVFFSVKTFLAERIDETVSGYTAENILNIYGRDLNTIDKIAGDVFKILQNMPGAINVQLQAPPNTPQLNIALRPKDLNYYGLDSVYVLSNLNVAYHGETVSQIYKGNEVIDVVVTLSQVDRKSPIQVRELPIKTPSGAIIKLQDVADVSMGSGRYVILHEGARRVQTITFDVSGKDLGSFMNEAQNKITEAVHFPAGIYMAFEGTAQAQQQTIRELLINSVLTFFAMILLLSIVLNNRNNLSLVLLNLPFSLIGGIIAAFITGAVLTLGSLVGFVTLFGISLRNSVMMMSHFEHLVLIEGHPWELKTALQGAMERFLPIIMTALVTALGLLPIAIHSGNPGREIEGPMAIVILGGLITSTLLNLFILPSVALRFAKFERMDMQG